MDVKWCQTLVKTGETAFIRIAAIGERGFRLEVSTTPGTQMVGGFLSARVREAKVLENVTLANVVRPSVFAKLLLIQVSLPASNRDRDLEGLSSLMVTS